jgi:tungstate transport system substrate-binding protein
LDPLILGPCIHELKSVDMPRVHLHRPITIQASPKQTFDAIANDRIWPTWSPWLRAQPQNLGSISPQIFLVGLFMICGCSADVRQSVSGDPTSETVSEVVQTDAPSPVLRLATTTSTRDSGLLDQLLPIFEQASGCRVDVIAVGTGAALKLGEAGDVDVVMVHARCAEEEFMAAEHGVRHEEFMYNDFVILGPKEDPAKIRDRDPLVALTQIAKGSHCFVSRGDDSGTHKRELSLWEAADIRPPWDEYVESGQGMGPSLTMADEMSGYVLADRGTYLNFKDQVDLVPLAAPADSLRNPYAVIVVNPEKHEKINEPLANALVDFLISEEAQQWIAEYRVGGQPLFYPTRLFGD